MRWSIGIVGLLSAAGFAYCGYAYVYAFPNPNALYWCAAFCLLIVVACLGGLVGNIAQRVIGAAVCLAYISYFVYELTQPSGTFVSGRRSQPSVLNALFGFILFGVPGGAWAIFGGKLYKESKQVAQGFARMSELENDMQEARVEGLVYCRWIEDAEIDEPEEILEMLAPGEDGFQFERANRKAAREFADTILHRNVRTGKRVLTVAAVEPLMVRFWIEARADEPEATFWTAREENSGAIAIRSGDQSTILIVNDENLEEDE